MRSRSGDDPWLDASPHRGPGHLGRRTCTYPCEGFTPSRPVSCAIRNQPRAERPPLSSPKWVMNLGGGSYDIVDATGGDQPHVGRVAAFVLGVTNLTGNPATSGRRSAPHMARGQQRRGCAPGRSGVLPGSLSIGPYTAHHRPGRRELEYCSRSRISNPKLAPGTDRDCTRLPKHRVGERPPQNRAA